jgi:hypothetical protein
MRFLFVIAALAIGSAAQAQYRVTNNTAPRYTVVNRCAVVAPSDVTSERITTCDGCFYEKRSDGYYWRISDAPAKFVGISSRAPVGHTHTCANGHTWDHSVTAGHDCPTCGLPQYVQDTAPKRVTVGAASSSGGCTNGQCEAISRPASRFAFP